MVLGLMLFRLLSWRQAKLLEDSSVSENRQKIPQKFSGEKKFLPLVNNTKHSNYCYRLHSLFVIPWKAETLNLEALIDILDDLDFRPYVTVRRQIL